MAHFRLDIKVILTVFTTDRIADRPSGTEQSSVCVCVCVCVRERERERERELFRKSCSLPPPSPPSTPPPPTPHSPPRASLNSHLFTDSADHIDINRCLKAPNRKTRHHAEAIENCRVVSVVLGQITSALRNSDCFPFSFVVVFGTTDRPITHTTMNN